MASRQPDFNFNFRQHSDWQYIAEMYNESQQTNGEILLYRRIDGTFSQM
jgi:hypothetical protein